MPVMFTNVDNNKHVGLVNEYADCERTWSLARKWLKRCVESHTSCTNLSLERGLPSRLVYIEAQESLLHLCFSQNLSEDTQYLTLSHCWGKKAFTTLTRDNLETFARAIPTEALSKTFREALKATLELGFHFIWIDSLCIVQDDSNDWGREAATMGRIYANSTLNLAAVDALDGDTGCFFSRRSYKVYGWKVLAKLGDDDPSECIWNCFAGHFFEKLWESHQLSTRAWVYQERSLLHGHSVSV